MLGPEGAVRKAFGQIVDQFIDHDAGRDRCIVPDTASAVGHDEAGSGRQQRFDDGEPVLVADVPVTSLTGAVGHEIEGGGTWRGGKDIAVHAHQAHDSRWQGLSFGEPAQGDAVTQPGRVRGGRVRKAVKDIAYDLEGKGRAAMDRLVLELPDGSAQGIDLIRFVWQEPAGLRQEEAVDHVVEGDDPVCGPAFHIQAAAQAEDGLAVGHETAQDLEGAFASEPETPALQPAGSDAVNRPADIRRRIAEKKAAQALVPCVAGLRILALVPAVLAIDAPADCRGMHPAANVDQVIHVDTETPADQRCIERRHHLLGAASRADQDQQVEEGAQRGGLDGPAARQRHRNLAARFEDRRDRGIIACGIGREDVHIRRLNVGVLLEEVEKTVVENLGLARGGVAGVDLQRSVGRHAVCPFLSGKPEIENVALKIGQAVAALGFDEAVEVPCVLHVDEGIEGVASNAPPGRQKLVSLRDVKRVGIVVPGTHDRLETGEDVTPVLPAGIDEAVVDLHPGGDAAEQVEIGGRQGRNGEERHALGPLGGNGVAIHGRMEAIKSIHPVALAGGGHQFLPQSRLPVRGIARFPFPDPLGPVKQAAVEHPGNLAREIESLARISILQVAPDRRSDGLSGERGQHVEQAPPQVVWRKGLHVGQIGNHVPDHRPGKLCRQFKAVVRRDSVGAGQFQGKPAPHGRVRDHHPLGGEGIGRILPHARREIPGECLETVGMVNMHSRFAPADMPP